MTFRMIEDAVSDRGVGCRIPFGHQYLDFLDLGLGIGLKYECFIGIGHETSGSRLNTLIISHEDCRSPPASQVVIALGERPIALISCQAKGWHWGDRVGVRSVTEAIDRFAKLK
jgi:hypothetical protein